MQPVLHSHSPLPSPHYSITLEPLEETEVGGDLRAMRLGLDLSGRIEECIRLKEGIADIFVDDVDGDIALYPVARAIRRLRKPGIDGNDDGAEVHEDDEDLRTGEFGALPPPPDPRGALAIRGAEENGLGGAAAVPMLVGGTNVQGGYEHLPGPWRGPPCPWVDG